MEKIACRASRDEGKCFPPWRKKSSPFSWKRLKEGVEMLWMMFSSQVQLRSSLLWKFNNTSWAEKRESLKLNFFMTFSQLNSEKYFLRAVLCVLLQIVPFASRMSTSLDICWADRDVEEVWHGVWDIRSSIDFRLSMIGSPLEIHSRIHSRRGSLWIPLTLFHWMKF